MSTTVNTCLAYSEPNIAVRSGPQDVVNVEFANGSGWFNITLSDDQARYLRDKLSEHLHGRLREQVGRDAA